MAKLDARLELRLDKRTFERLERRAAAGHLSVAEVVRRAIARELEGDEGSWREQALERGLSLTVPVPADPMELARELDARYEPESGAGLGLPVGRGTEAAHATAPPMSPGSQAGVAPPAPGDRE